MPRLYEPQWIPFRIWLELVQTETFKLHHTQFEEAFQNAESFTSPL
jgi:hypothetical protein